MRKFKVIISLLQFIIVPATSTWVFVEFLIYLFKDHPFNWWSFGIFVGNLTFMAIFMLIHIQIHIRRKIRMEKERMARIEEIQSKRNVGIKKSKFQARLEDAMKASEERKLKQKENERNNNEEV